MAVTVTTATSKCYCSLLLGYILTDCSVYKTCLFVIGRNTNTAVVLYACMILLPRPALKERGMDAEDAPSITLSALFICDWLYKKGPYS